MKNFKTVNINLIKRNQNNPRTIKDENFKKLVKSITEFPEMLEIRPIVVNEDMVVLGGNMRLAACKEAGLKNIPIIVADNLSEEQQKEFIIKDNVSGGEWDWELLLKDWDTELLTDWGIDLPETETPETENTEKPEFETITFTLADRQAEEIRRALEAIKNTVDFEYCETMGNENSDGNALYTLVLQWLKNNAVSRSKK